MKVEIFESLSETALTKQINHFISGIDKKCYIKDIQLQTAWTLSVETSDGVLVYSALVVVDTYKRFRQEL